MAMKGQGIAGQLTGSLVAMIGINLPGLILILFIIPFWESLKKITRIKNAMAGINAVAVGLMIAAAIIMFEPIAVGWLPVGLALLTFILLSLTRIPAPVRSEEHTSELQSLMRISYAVFCLKKKQIT